MMRVNNLRQSIGSLFRFLKVFVAGARDPARVPKGACQRRSAMIATSVCTRGCDMQAHFVKKITNTTQSSLTLPAALIRLTATIRPDVLKTVGVKPLFSAVLRSAFPFG